MTDAAGDFRRSMADELVPLVIGVTGHRDLRPQDVPALERAVLACLDEISRLCPNTPLVLMSPLAEGADRLVADLALERKVALVVPLPLPLAEYKKDFKHENDETRSAQSEAEFDRLLARATRHFELGLVPGNTPETISVVGAARNQQYLQVGAYIVRHCHLLIALWDGKVANPEPVGGTSQIVFYRRHGLPSAFAVMPNPLDAADAGPVLRIHTPRSHDTQAALTEATAQLLMPVEPNDSPPSGDKPSKGDAQGLALLGSLFRHHARYNAAIAVLAGTDSMQFKEIASYLVAEPQAAKVDDQSRCTMHAYVAADWLAQRSQAQRKQVLKTLFSIAVAAVFFFECFAHLATKPWVFMLYPMALLTGYAVFRWARYHEYHQKHVDYRALAEGLRVQFYWQVAGVRQDVSDHYLRRQRTDLEWVRMALRTQNQLVAWGLRPSTPVATQDASAEPLTDTERLGAIQHIVLPQWVAGQGKYFSNSSQRDRRSTRRREWWAVALLIGGMIAGVLAMVQPDGLSASATVSWSHGLIILMGLTPAIAAAMGGYAERMAIAAQARRYGWMAALYARAQQGLEEALGLRIKESTTEQPKPSEHDKVEGATELVLELGREALEENGDWVMMHRERPPEAPKGS